MMVGPSETPPGYRKALDPPDGIVHKSRTSRKTSIGEVTTDHHCHQADFQGRKASISRDPDKTNGVVANELLQ